MAAWEEPAAEWSCTNVGALDSSGTASAAEKENLGRCRGYLLLVHVTHNAAGKEQGRHLHQRSWSLKEWERVISQCQILTAQGQCAIPMVGTTCPFQDWRLVLTSVRGGRRSGSSLTALLMVLELQQKCSKMKPIPEEFMA